MRDDDSKIPANVRWMAAHAATPVARASWARIIERMENPPKPKRVRKQVEKVSNNG